MFNTARCPIACRQEERTVISEPGKCARKLSVVRVDRQLLPLCMRAFQPRRPDRNETVAGLPDAKPRLHVTSQLCNEIAWRDDCPELINLRHGPSFDFRRHLDVDAYADVYDNIATVVRAFHQYAADFGWTDKYVIRPLEL